MASPQRTTQLLWFLAQTLPWLGDLDGIANHQIRRAFLGARHRAFGTVGEAVGCLEYTLGVRPSSSRRMPAPSEAQERVLEALEITPDQYDFYATYETAVGTDLYVFTSGTAVSESCTVSPRIEGGLRRHFHRTGRVSLRSSPNREVAEILADSTVTPQLDVCGLDPFAARIYMAVSAIRPGQTRSLDWVMRSPNVRTSTSIRSSCAWPTIRSRTSCRRIESWVWRGPRSSVNSPRPTQPCSAAARILKASWTSWPGEATTSSGLVPESTAS